MKQSNGLEGQEATQRENGPAVTDKDYDRASGSCISNLTIYNAAYNWLMCVQKCFYGREDLHIQYMKYNGMNVHVFKHTEQQHRFSELGDTVHTKEKKKCYGYIMSLPQKKKIEDTHVKRNKKQRKMQYIEIILKGLCTIT